MNVAAWASERQHVAVWRGRPSIRHERAMRPMKADELLQFLEQRHATRYRLGLLFATDSRLRLFRQRLASREHEFFLHIG